MLKYLFKKILNVTEFNISDIENEEIKNSLKLIIVGCVVLILIKNFDVINITQNEIYNYSTEKYLEFLRNNYLDSITCYNSNYKLSKMINK